MVDLVTYARLLGGIALLLSNGFFVTTEFALTRVRQFSEAEFSGPGLERAWKMTERLEIYLSGCQVGITISSIGLGVVGEPAFAAVVDALFGAVGLTASSGGGHTAAAVVVSFAIINLLHVIVGEQAPTYLGIERTKFVARYGATPLYVWTKVMAPVILFSDRVAKGLLGVFGVDIDRSWTEAEHDEPSTRGELRRQMGDELARMDLPEERQEEVLAALSIDRVTVGDAMVDREDVVAVRTEEDVAANVDRMGGSPHVRFPVVGESVDDYRGVVYMPQVLDALDELRAGERTFAELAEPPLTLAADTSISDAIDRFQAESQELALVTDDDDRVVGLLTATDALEQIAGDIEDPMDREAER